MEDMANHRLSQIGADFEADHKSSYLHAEITGDVIGAAMEVHRTLHSGFVESVYEEALAIELVIRKIPFERQRPLDVMYKGRPAKHFVCDMIVGSKVLVELKAFKKLSENDYAQLLNYLKATGMKLGLLLNFGGQSLEVKRVINDL